MELPVQAERALIAVRQRARSLRFEIRKACEQERWRLKVVYISDDADPSSPMEVQLGLLWSEDLEGLMDLKRRLEESSDAQRTVIHS